MRVPRAWEKWPAAGSGTVEAPDSGDEVEFGIAGLLADEEPDVPGAEEDGLPELDELDMTGLVPEDYVEGADANSMTPPGDISAIPPGSMPGDSLPSDPQSDAFPPGIGPGPSIEMPDSVNPPEPPPDVPGAGLMP